MKELKEPKFWLATTLTVALVFIAHYFSSPLEQGVVNKEQYAWIILFLYYVIFIGLGQALINKLIKKD